MSIDLEALCSPGSFGTPQSAKHKHAVLDYYAQTRAEYFILWQTYRNLGLHFGYYDEQHQTHNQAVINMNAKLAKQANITQDDYILDAGCGVGGSTIWLAVNVGCRAVGINLVPRQINQAKASAAKRQVNKLVSFKIADYADTGFKDNTFTVVWGLESIVHAEDKQAVLNEAFRILKPGGRLIISECLLKETPLLKEEQTLLNCWLEGWAMPSLMKEKQYRTMGNKAGLKAVTVEDWTSDVMPSFMHIKRWVDFFKPLSPFLHRVHTLKSNQATNREATQAQMELLAVNAWSYKVLLFTKP